jgi:hypothetical protein
MKEAAYALNVTPDTVAGHKYRIMEILHAKSYAELVQYAIKTISLLHRSRDVRLARTTFRRRSFRAAIATRITAG